MEDHPEKKEPGQDMDVDELIAQRERLDKLFKDQFTKAITVMFTDLKGSTSIAETQGDFAVRSLIKQHNEILFPVVKKCGGTLVKSMGDGTMSYFPNPQEAVRAAVEIQKGMDAFNLERKIPTPILMRIGIHTGEGIVEKNDIFGDVVNVASRIEGQANPGEIYLSEEAYNALSDKAETYCGFVKEATLKGKRAPVKLYKAFWNPSEVDRAIAASTVKAPEAPAGRKLPLPVKIVLSLAVTLLVAFAVVRWMGSSSSGDERRTVEHSVAVPDAPK
ncbi:MAG: adenylate/guanylate cyclase domain-containing protein [Elusimicrobia bacterium]|nr:adenylate/guanylate cyclase domain-containing protein [Elusimicrobiota bacterium]